MPESTKLLQAWKIIASPDADEDEWLKACQLVGDRKAPPAVLKTGLFVDEEYKAKKTRELCLESALLTGRFGAFLLDGFLLMAAFGLYGIISGHTSFLTLSFPELASLGLAENIGLAFTMLPLWLTVWLTTCLHGSVELASAFSDPNSSLNIVIGAGGGITQLPTHLFFLKQSTLFGVLDLKTWLVLALFSWLYRAGLQASPMQATPGEFLFGLKITTKEGKRLSLKQATLRHFARFLCPLSLGAAYFLPLINQQQKSIEDIVTGTKVSSIDQPKLEEELEMLPSAFKQQPFPYTSMQSQ
ncbi:MAG: RDD family protein [Candidatus Melainabacteria bacterium]|nr:RDD family protein [Candidatus Melainabacteria bacterium]